MSSVSHPRPCIITTTPRLSSTGLPFVVTGRPVCGFVISLLAPGASWNQARAGARGAPASACPADGVRATAPLSSRLLLRSSQYEGPPPGSFPGNLDRLELGYELIAPVLEPGR